MKFQPGKLLFALWVSLWLASAHAQDLTISLDNLRETPLVDRAEFWVADQDSTLMDAGEATFKPLTRTDINQGMSDKAFWLRVTLVNQDDEASPWVLVHKTSYLDNLEIYQRDSGNGGVERIHLSDRVPFAERPVDYRTLAHRAETPAYSETELYLKLYYDKADSISLQFTLYSPEAFSAAVQHENLFFGAYYGALLVMIFLAISVGLLLRRPSVFTYAALLIATGWKWLLLNGFGFQYLWPGSVYWHNEGFHIAFLLFALCASQFSKMFLGTQTRFPRAHKLLQALQVICLAAIAVRLLGWYAPTLHISFAMLTLVAILLPVIGVKAWRSGVHYARWYVLAWAIYSVSLLLAGASAYLNVIPYGMHALALLQVGSVLEAVFLTIALTERLLALETERRKAVAMAQQDPLTGLGNRRLLQTEYERFRDTFRADSKPMYLLMIDLDHFKKVNDQFGHDAGDQVLKEVAELLTAHCRDTDVCIRYGGEEFAMMVRADSVESARGIAERIRKEFANTPTLYAGVSIPHTLSCGITPIQRNQEPLTVNDMMKHADQALYEGKAAGRNCTVIYRESLSNPYLRTLNQQELNGE